VPLCRTTKSFQNIGHVDAVYSPTYDGPSSPYLSLCRESTCDHRTGDRFVGHTLFQRCHGLVKFTAALFALALAFQEGVLVLHCRVRFICESSLESAILSSTAGNSMH
jgi:hypothetical protein